jgi:hypothetical protein
MHRRSRTENAITCIATPMDETVATKPVGLCAMELGLNDGSNPCFQLKATGDAGMRALIV